MADTDLQKVGILGAGTIGSSWAGFFASKGLSVRYFDAVEDTQAKAGPRIEGALSFLQANALATLDDCEKGRRALQPVGSVEELADGVDFIQESATEDYDVKKRVLAEAERAAPEGAIIASSSSGLLMTELQKALARPEQTLIAHPFNPPHLVPLVELVPGRETSEATLDRVRGFFAALGKVPVRLKRETPGHIANRLAAALWREAIDLVASGVADVEEVDKALHAGPGLRWAIMGQHMIYHLGGGDAGYRGFIEHIGKTFEQYWETMANWSQIPEDAREAVIDGVERAAQGRSMPELAAWRDEKLVKLLKALRD